MTPVSFFGSAWEDIRRKPVCVVLVSTQTSTQCISVLFVNVATCIGFVVVVTQRMANGLLYRSKKECRVSKNCHHSCYRSSHPDEPTHLKMNEDIGIEPSFHREWPTMNDRMRFIKYHISWLHGNVYSPSIVANDFEGPA